MSQQTKLWLAITVGIILLAIAIFFGFFYNPKLTVLPTPSTAVVQLGGRTIPSGVAQRLSPGTYTVTVQADEYLSASESISLRISEHRTLKVTLTPIPATKPLASDAQFPALGTDNKTVVYLGNQGKQFMRITSDGSQKQPLSISTDRFSGIKEVMWSTDRDLAVLKTEDGRTKLFDFHRYDLLSQVEQDLPTDWRDVAWHPADPVVTTFIVAQSGEKSLFRRNVRTQEQDRLSDLRDQPFTNPQLTWSPDGRTIVLVENGVYLFEILTRTLAKIAGTDGAQNATFSPDGKNLLVNYEGEIGTVDLKTLKITKPGLRTKFTKATWWDNQSILLALTTDQGQDRLALIDPNSLESTAITYQHEGRLEMTNLLADAANQTIWFTSQDNLFSLKLNKGE